MRSQSLKIIKNDAFLAVEKGFQAQKYLKTASNRQKSLMNLVGDVPKYICTKFEVIWFTPVAVIQKTGFSKFPKTGQNRFFGFFSHQRPKMIQSHKRQKNPFINRVLLCFLCQGHFKPLEAEKAKKQILTRFWKFRKTSFLYYSHMGQPNDLKFGTYILWHILHKIYYWHCLICGCFEVLLGLKHIF